MFNATLLLDTDVLPFPVGSIYHFNKYRIIVSKTPDRKVVDGVTVWTRRAGVLSHKGAFGESTLRVLDESDNSRPVAGYEQSEACILCACKVFHTSRLHSFLSKAS